MGRIAIRAEGLGKRYALGARAPYHTLRDALGRALSMPRRRSRPAASSAARPAEVWALRDVSLEVWEGEVVGIVGRNGAGKSTLLRVLARITTPSAGSAETFGRVGSLLEVGTGFHPELTGRENVYLNGAILGMRRSDVAREFDSIVAFAGVADFIDTPIKHYSSGMYVRLAFAVAAHLEPEILLVDEVLAVGDLEFQRRCLGRMGEVAKSGRTVLLVSHQMNQIRRLCGRSMWLDGGRVRAAGPTADVVAAYEAQMISPGAEPRAGGDCFVRWTIGGQGHIVKEPQEPLELRFGLELRAPVSLGHFGVAIVNDASVIVAGWGFDRVSLPAGAVQLSVTPRALPIRPGTYSIVASLWDGGNNLTGGTLLECWQAVPPLIVDTVPLAHPQDAWAGVLNVPAELSIRPGVAARSMPRE